MKRNAADNTHSAPRSRRATRRGAGFTIIELLVVVAVIIILASLLITAMNLATQTAQKANTQALMSSISQGLVAFRDDVGYLPPVLGAEPTAVSGPDDLRGLWRPVDYLPLPIELTGAVGPYSTRMQDWFSYASLAEYLIGYDRQQYDGYGTLPTAMPAEYPPTGIRHPGDDGVWNATLDGAGSLDDRDPIPVDQGGPATVYGPYLELDNPRLLGSTDGTFRTVEVNGEEQQRLNVYFPGDEGYDPDHPKVIMDYWGEPIRYYRKVYAGNNPAARYRKASPTSVTEHLPTLADVFVLRPYEFDQGAGTEVDPAFADDRQDISVSHELKAAEFALFSGGPDKTFDENARRDAGEFNKDNIVELGQ